ncbi:MAG: hypothetical protein HC927_06215, partial [Deltaproteobacteria bacterium]|nr:hypothetical protein [Deltaproteobacteria bacterium]
MQHPADAAVPEIDQLELTDEAIEHPAEATLAAVAALQDRQRAGDLRVIGQLDHAGLRQLRWDLDGDHPSGHGALVRQVEVLRSRPALEPERAEREHQGSVVEQLGAGAVDLGLRRDLGDHTARGRLGGEVGRAGDALGQITGEHAQQHAEQASDRADGAGHGVHLGARKPPSKGPFSAARPTTRPVTQVSVTSKISMLASGTPPPTERLVGVSYSRWSGWRSGMLADHRVA